MNLKFYLGALLSIPLLPVMAYQGKRIRARVPRLPEAEETTVSCKVIGGAERSVQLIAIGESTIAGVGVKTHAEGFTGTLASELAERLHININWKVYARSGYTAARITRKIVPKIAEHNVDLIVIGLGGNDAFKLHSPGRWRRDIQALILALRSKYPKAPIIFCNMPPIKEFPAFPPVIKWTIGNLVEILGQELQKVVNQHNRVYYYGEIITLQSWIEKLQINATKADFFSDGVHPSKLTYQTWAQDIATRISCEREIKNALQPG